MYWFDILTFEKLYLLKKGPIFVGSYAIQNKLIQKSIHWHQLFRQKWAFPRLSTSVLHKCGHTTSVAPRTFLQKIWLFCMFVFPYSVSSTLIKFEFTKDTETFCIIAEKKQRLLHSLLPEMSRLEMLSMTIN